MSRLKLVTLNTWGRSGPWPARKAAIVAGLAALDPDVIGLQEVWEDADGNSAAEIAAALGPAWRVHHAAAHQLAADRTVGNAVLARHELVECEAWRLPAPAGDWARNLVYATVRTPHGLLPVFVTHLSWMFHHGAVRLQQVQQVRSWMKERAPIDKGPRAGDVLPPVFMGDLNAVPEADEIRFLTGLMADEYGHYLADCFAWCGEGAGITWDRANPFAALEPFPSRRIDYIFVRGPDRWRRGEPKLARVVLVDPVGDVYPSDHYGVYAELGC
jgi:endonuclease/exonuclease/phosphatase family metal-dependent hydrolase